MTTGSFGKIECTHCGGHIEYPEQAGGMSVACPHCQQTVALPTAMTSRPSKRRWGLLVAVLLGISLIGWGGWFAFSKQAARANDVRPSVLPNPPPADLQRMKQLAFWDFSIQQKEGSTITHAVARVLNESGATRYGVEVRLELPHRVGHCRWHPAELRRGAGEAAAPRNRIHQLQGFERNGHLEDVRFRTLSG